MQLIPNYADGGAGSTSDGTAPGVTIDPSARQSLGIRTAAARIGSLTAAISVTGSIEFNQRDLANSQARSGGFVQRTSGRPTGDGIGAGAPMADLQLSGWGGAQTEFLPVKRPGYPVPPPAPLP